MDEKKKYEIIGRVEIGTDEYRDLIEQSAKCKAEMEDYRSRYWNEQDKVKKAESRVAELEEKLENFRSYINSSELRKSDYLAYKTATASEEAEI